MWVRGREKGKNEEKKKCSFWLTFPSFVFIFRQSPKTQVILAALLHDFGHICAAEDAEQMGDPTHGVAGHEFVGGLYLRLRGFSEEIISLVAAHVDSKRYLTFKRGEEYYSTTRLLCAFATRRPRSRHTPSTFPAQTRTFPCWRHTLMSNEHCATTANSTRPLSPKFFR